MQLAPGPIPVIAVDFSTFPSGSPGFSDLVTEFGTIFDVFEGYMEGLLPIAATIPATLPSDGNEIDLSTLDSNIGALGAFDGTPDLATGDAQIGDLSEKLLVAYAVIPGEAFEPLPAQYSTNPLFPGLAPPSVSTATLNNLTRPGDSNFYPGDQYEIAVELAPTVGGAGAYAGVDVTIYPVQNGTALDPQDLCNTDANGFLKAVGTFQVGDVGNWVVTIAYEILAGGGINGGPIAADNTILTFAVLAAPSTEAPPAGSMQIIGGGLHPVQTLGAPCLNGPAVGATLINTSNPGAAGFMSGDSWQLTVTGPADYDVLISALFNGAALPWVFLGVTDPNGNFVLTGTLDDTYLGTWVENFQVGSQVWSGNIPFTVSPAPPAAS